MNDLQAKIVSFYGRKFSFTETRQRNGKRGICDRKMIQFMPVNHSNKWCYHDNNNEHFDEVKLK